MPATAGRVKMPMNNRLSTTASLGTHSIWQESVGYDPYAGNAEGKTAKDDGEINAKAKGLFALARLTGSSTSYTPGACKLCGQVGHLKYQCRNMIKLDSAPSTREESTLIQPDIRAPVRPLRSPSSDSSTSKSKKKKSKKSHKKHKKEKKEKKEKKKDKVRKESKKSKK
eukprot:Platyproteum_vivax@DN12187_c0_g1_i1.p1